MTPLTIALVSAAGIAITIGALLCLDYGVSDFYGGGCAQRPPR